MDASSFRRRNGRPQACEPCRKRKVACDHTHPICRRCAKGKQERSCVYIVSNGARDDVAANSSPRAVRAHSRHARLALSLSSPAGSPPPGLGDDVSTPAPAPSGYLGYTSYCSVFEETQSILIGSRLGPAAISTPERESTGAVASSPTRLSSLTLDACLRVLNSVPEPTTGIKRFCSHILFDSFPHAIAKRILHSFYDTFGQYLGRDRNPLHLELVARKLCRNTARPFSETEPDAKKWVAQLVGDNLRWESVGILFAFWSLRTWKGHSNTVAALSFLGLHADSNPPDYKPTLVSEFRRSPYAWVYSLDKVVVFFTGRHPLLSNVFSSTPLPLELSNETLLSDENSRVEGLHALDRDGWGNRLEIYPSTVHRVRATLAAMKERILRIALGHGEPLSLKTLLDLKGAALEAFSRLPTVIRYRPGDLDASSVENDMLYPRLIMHIDHLQNILLIERLLLRNGKEERADILGVSFELVSDTLLFWTHSLRLAKVRDDCDCLVMAYAAPAAGILCLELLKPTAHTGIRVNPEITRLRIVQKLSLLLGFFDWIQPFAPNRNHCTDCSLIIRHVLDHSLNNVSLEDEMSNTFEWDLDGVQPSFDFDLLDTFDWLSGDTNLMVA